MSKKNPKVDAFVERAKQWQGETKKLRSIMLGCGLNEELKWGKPCYAYDGNNLAIVQGFKEHCSLMFFKGALLKDPDGHLVSQGKNTQAAMRMQFTSLKQVREMEPIVRSFVDQAIEVEKQGRKVDFKAKDDLQLPDELKAKLDRDAKLSKAFFALTPGRRRGYVLHISGAKQSATRSARVDRCRDRILQGKGLNDR